MRCGGIAAFVCLIAFANSSYCETLIEHASVKTATLGLTAVSKGFGGESIGINVAALAADSPTIITGYSSHFDNSYVTAELGAYAPISETIAAGVIAAIRQVSDIPETIGVGGKGVKIGTISDSELSVKTGVSVQLDSQWSVGSAIGYYSHAISSETGSQLSVDLGSLYQYDSIRIGVSAQNITQSGIKWSTGHVDADPMKLIVGASLDIQDVTLLTSITQIGDRSEYGFGVTYQIGEFLMMNGGIQNALDQPRIGLGMDLKMDRTALMYRYIRADDLGYTHKLGVEFAL